MIPSNCVLYKKSDLSQEDVTDYISEIIEIIPSGGLDDYQVRRCRECGTLYIVEHNHFFGGEDDYPVYRTYVPVTEKELEEFRAIEKKDLFTIMTFGETRIKVDEKSQNDKSITWAE